MKKSFALISLFLFSSLTFASYEDHFPTYFEYCTGTRWRLQSGEEGGKPGHGFTYIHGLCKDYRSSYPQVIPCSEISPELKEQYPHEGVGISLDKNFKNVMWVAVPGRDFTIFGDIEPRYTTYEDVKNVIQKAIDLKIFNDVIHKGEKAQSFSLNSPEYLEAVADATLGTDYAVNWARELHCVKVPVKKESLPKVAEFLNEVNNQYKENAAYEWDKISDNCAHLAINTSHLMGINKSINIGENGVKKYLNMALPTNTFMMYADQTVVTQKPGLRKLKGLLNTKGFSPVQVGALITNYPAFPSGDKFSTDDLTVLTAPRVMKPLKLLMTPEKYERYMTPKNSELTANAESWKTHYEKLLGKLGANDEKVETYLLKQLEIIDAILK